MYNPDEKTREFNRELCHLINKYSIENHSNTADFVLANYLMGCLEAFNDAVNVRTNLSQTAQTSDKSDKPSGCDSGDIDKLRAENEELKQNTEFMDNIGWDRAER